MTLDLHPAALVALGFGLCLLSVLLLLVSFIWISIGGHVARVLTEAGKRAVSARLGDPLISNALAAEEAARQLARSLAEPLQKRPTPDDRGEHVSDT
jgi:hypothetical protein